MRVGHFTKSVGKLSSRYLWEKCTVNSVDAIVEDAGEPSTKLSHKFAFGLSNQPLASELTELVT